MTETSLWAAYMVFVLLMLALDLGVFHRDAHVVSAKEALTWTCIWVTISLAFNVLVFFIYNEHWFGMGLGANQATSGEQAALEFFTGYLIEKSLSLDNIFVIALVFSYFRIPGKYQHRVLFWGVLGAVVMRGAMIAAGAALIARFSGIVYVFGAFLLLTAVKMLVSSEEGVSPERNPAVRLARWFFPVTQELDGSKFFTKLEGKRAITPLFLVLILVESTDVLFAVDSVPAIFAVTRDPFLVFTSNIFAILGLRSLYFALAQLMQKFCFMKASLVFLLAFVGVKMILTHHYPIPTMASLAIIISILGVGIVASVVAARREPSGNRT